MNGTTHIPTSYINRMGKGIRTLVGCSCGWMPNRPPMSGTTRANAFKRHATEHGIEFVIVDDVFGEGPFIGLTHDQYFAIAPDCDPYGERPCKTDDCACRTYTANRLVSA